MHFTKIALVLPVITLAYAAVFKYSSTDLEKRGPFKNLFCLKGNFDGSEAYCKGSAACTSSTHSIEVLDLHEVGVSPSEKDAAYENIKEKLWNIMHEMRNLQAELADGNDFNDLENIEKLKLLCRARNSFFVLKIRVESISYIEWAHFFDMARREDLKGLDCFQTNIYELFEHVKDLIDHYSKSYKISGVDVKVEEEED